MQLAGLIDRRRSQRDGRESVLSLTRAGRRALAADMKARDAWLQTALGTLGQTEVEVLLIASRILDRLAEAGPESSALAGADPDETEDTGTRGIAS
jgi:DNA-binding MarR family transcriptional regulator